MIGYIISLQSITVEGLIKQYNAFSSSLEVFCHRNYLANKLYEFFSIIYIHSYQSTVASEIEIRTGGAFRGGAASIT